jgi:hypothetical protein
MSAGRGKAHVALFIAGLCMGAYAQASDTEDHTQHTQQGIEEHTKQHEKFLGKYLHQILGSEASATSQSDYDKFMVGNLPVGNFESIKHGDRFVALPYSENAGMDNVAMDNAVMDNAQRHGGIDNFENAAMDNAQRHALPNTAEQASTMMQTHDANTFTSFQMEPNPSMGSGWYTVSDSVKMKIADKGTENHAAQELHSADNAPTGSTAIFFTSPTASVGSIAVFFVLLPFAAAFLVVWRRLWPSYAFAASDEHRSGRSPALVANTLELPPQATSIPQISGVIENSSLQSRVFDPLPIPLDRSSIIEPWFKVEAADIGGMNLPWEATCKDNFRRSGWVQPSHLDMRAQTVRFAKLPDAAMYEDLRARVEELRLAPSDENAQLGDTSADPMYKDLHARVEELHHFKRIQNLPDNAWILIIQGKDGGIGVHSLSSDKDGDGIDTVLLFETFEQAQHIGLHLFAQGFFAAPKHVNVAKLAAGLKVFGSAARISLKWVPEGCALLPPEKNADKLDRDTHIPPTERCEDDALYVGSAAAPTPSTRRALMQTLAFAGTATLAGAANAEGPPGGFQAKPVDAKTGSVNINTAQAPAYMEIPGMYPTIASRIVEYVRYNGRFKKVSDLYECEDIIQGNENIKAVIKRNEARLTVN